MARVSRWESTYGRTPHSRATVARHRVWTESGSVIDESYPIGPDLRLGLEAAHVVGPRSIQSEFMLAKSHSSVASSVGIPRSLASDLMAA